VVRFENSYSGFASSTNTYRFLKDTTINDKRYFQLFEADDPRLNQFIPKNEFLREDTLEKKIYGLSTINGEERLLYDFSLSENDTIIIDSDICNMIKIVETVDDILIDNIPRKRIKFNSDEENPEAEYWIEGIGSTYGLVQFDKQCIINYWYALLCVYKNDILIYENPNYMDCYVSTVSLENIEFKQERININYNPLTFNFEGIDTKIANFQIFAINGSLIKIIKMSGEKQVIFNEYDLAPGIYLINFSNKKTFIRNKIVILPNK
jgi:hypothetical protein